MKLLLSSLFLLLLFNACADKDAFSKFKLTQEQEYAENSIQSAKIRSKEGVEGIVSIIYLNDVMPQKYNDKEYFFIFYTLKDETKRFNILLNSQLPLQQTALPTSNEFSKLIVSDIKWNKYYLIEYKKEKSKLLEVQLKGQELSSSVFKYKKDEE